MFMQTIDLSIKLFIAKDLGASTETCWSHPCRQRRRQGWAPTFVSEADGRPLGMRKAACAALFPSISILSSWIYSLCQLLNYFISMLIS